MNRRDNSIYIFCQLVLMFKKDRFGNLNGLGVGWHGLIPQCSSCRHFCSNFVGTNTRRQLILWKFNPSGCLTTLRHNCAVESLAYSKWKRHEILFLYPLKLKKLEEILNDCYKFWKLLIFLKIFCQLSYSSKGSSTNI